MPGATSVIPSGASGPGVQTEVGFPAGVLGAAGGVDDAPESHEGVGGATHRAMLARGVDDAGCAVVGPHVLRGPARDRELRVPGGVAARFAVAVLEPDLTGLVHQQ